MRWPERLKRKTVIAGNSSFSVDSARSVIRVKALPRTIGPVDRGREARPKNLEFETITRAFFLMLTYLPTRFLFNLTPKHQWL
jgi:hypothetical protein